MPSVQVATGFELFYRETAPPDGRGAGHGLPWSHPHEFNRVVGEFLEAGG